MGFGDMLASLPSQRPVGDGAFVLGIVSEVGTADPGNSPFRGVSIWETGGVYDWDTTDSPASVVSTSVEDAPGGAGAETVLVEGVDPDGRSCLEIVTLNGTTPVFSSIVFHRVNDMSVGPCGSGQVNLGTISAELTGTPVSYVTALKGQSTGCQFTVPLDWNNGGMITHLWGQIANKNNSTAVLSVWGRPLGFGWRRFGVVTVSSDGGMTSFLPQTRAVLTPRMDMEITVEDVVTNDTSVTAGFDLVKIP